MQWCSRHGYVHACVKVSVCDQDSALLLRKMRSEQLSLNNPDATFHCANLIECTVGMARGRGEFLYTNPRRIPRTLTIPLSCRQPIFG